MTPMLSPQVTRHLATQPGDIHRTDRHEAEAALHRLGVGLDTPFAHFYLAYQGGFISPRPVDELMDIAGPYDPTILSCLDYMRDRYGLPAQYLPLTSDQGEGMYLYNAADGAVYDMDFHNLSDLLAGRLTPRWPGFNEFLIWYFELGEPQSGPGMGSV